MNELSQRFSVMSVMYNSAHVNLSPVSKKINTTWMSYLFFTKGVIRADPVMEPSIGNNKK